MKSACLTALGGILLTVFISNPASAHQTHAVTNPRPQQFMAIIPHQRPVGANDQGIVIPRSPIDDGVGTATGGPVGGLGS